MILVLSGKQASKVWCTVVKDAINGSYMSVASCVPCRSLASSLVGLLGQTRSDPPVPTVQGCDLRQRSPPLTYSRGDFTLVRASLLAIGGRPNRSTMELAGTASLRPVLLSNRRIPLKACGRWVSFSPCHTIPFLPTYSSRTQTSNQHVLSPWFSLFSLGRCNGLRSLDAICYTNTADDHERPQVGDTHTRG
jgi:hypothetical protein